uniref:Uncharacterized protein n=1 Tax=Anguilla anguilla TaxID=7936 RepID=A0A0E9SZ57_ANGAN
MAQDFSVSSQLFSLQRRVYILLYNNIR